MITLNIHEAKTHLSSILARVERDGEIAVICRNGEPIADLVPHRRASRTALHPVMSRIGIHYDAVEGLTDDEWPESNR